MLETNEGTSMLSKRQRQRDPVMRMVFSKPGFAVTIAKHLGLTHQNISAWKHVPAHHVLRLAPLLRMPPKDIRPDIFAKPERAQK
jgi:hypothetical protein